MELKLTVESASAAEIRLRLVGSVSLKREKGEFTYRYEPALLGQLAFDRAKDRFVRFDLLALGEWTWDYRPGQPRDLLGIALEIAPREFASPGFDRHFPGVSMSNYGYRQDRE